MPAKRVYACHFCKKRFRSDDALQSHIRCVHWAEPEFMDALPASAAAFGNKLCIVMEDDWVAVVVKPQGCPTQGKGSLARADWLLRQLQRSKAQDALRWPRPVHRLDAGTGGLLVLAKTSGALRSISASFANGLVQKRYRALVCGQISLGVEGQCNEPLYGKSCLTWYRACEQPVKTVEGWVSTLDLWPTSGRRHQLRRHLKLLGCPIVGDKRYGNNCCAGTGGAQEDGEQLDHDSGYESGGGSSAADTIAMPLFLWALEMSFPHPARSDNPTGVEQTAAMEPQDVQLQIEEPQIFQAFRAGEWHKQNSMDQEQVQT